MSNAAKFKKKAAEFELQKQFDKAVASYVRAIEVADADGEEIDVAILNKVGDLTLRLGRVAEAVASYERAVDHYAARGLYNNAIALCNKILRHAPGRAGIYLTLGRVCARKGMRGDATRNFLDYASRMKDEGRTDEAMRSLAEVAGLMPELEQVRQLVEEHAERAGVVLPSIGTAAPAGVPEGAVAADLVFLDVDYDAPITLTPPLGAPALGSSAAPTPAAPQPANRPGSPPARRGTLDEFLIFDPEEELAEPVELVVLPEVSQEDTGLTGAVPECVEPAPWDGESTAQEGRAITEPGLPFLSVTPIHEREAVPAAAADDERDAIVLDPAELDAAVLDDLALDESALDDLALDASVLDDSALDESVLDEPVREEALPEDDQGAPAGWTADLDSAMLSVTPVEGLVFVTLDTPIEPIDGLEIEEAVAFAQASDGTAPDGTADVEPEIGEERDLGSLPHPGGDPASREAFAAMRPDDLLAAEGAQSGTMADDILAGVVPLHGQPLDGPLQPLGVPRRARPVPRLNPHDFILPGELPPIRLPDVLLGLSAAPTSVDTEPTTADAAGPDSPSLEMAPEAARAVPGEAVDAGADDGAAQDGAVEGVRGEATPAPALEVELEGAFVRAFSGVYQAIPDVIETESVATPGSPAGTAAIVQLAIERCRRLREEVEAHPGDWARQRRLAEALLEAGEREEGLDELAATALALEVEGALAEAARVVDDLIRIEPERVAYHQKRVELAVRMGDRERLRESYLDLADALLRAGQASRAEPVYIRVLELDPWDDRARAALGDAAPPPPAARPQPKSRADDGYVNLADWLAEDTAPRDTRIRVEAPNVTGDEDADFDRLLQHFREGVARSLGDDDYESHYDLGVAYKEMGLLDDAVAEFQRALRSPAHRLPAYEALGQCFLEQGSFPVAVTVLSRALHEPGLDDLQRVGVLYLLGYACEALQRRDEARSYFQRVYATDQSFRDVAERLAALDEGAR